jgi:hypothetical protein
MSRAVTTPTLHRGRIGLPGSQEEKYESALLPLSVLRSSPFRASGIGLPTAHHWPVPSESTAAEHE